MLSILGYVGIHWRPLREPTWTDASLSSQLRGPNGWSVVRELPPLRAVVARVRHGSALEDEAALLTETHDAMDALIQHERFVERCAPPRCGDIVAFEAHALRMLHAMHADEARRILLMQSAWRHACDYAAHAGSERAVDVGLDMLELTLEHHTLVDDVATVYSLALPDELPERAVIAQYREHRRYFEDAEQLVLFDKREITDWLAASYSDIHAYAARPADVTAGSPMPPRFGDRASWWIYDVRGRHWADRFHRTNLELLVYATDERRRRVAALRQRLALLAEPDRGL